VPQSHLWIQQGAELAEFALTHLGMPNVHETSETFATAIEQAFGIDVRVMELDGGCDGLALSSNGGAKVLLVATTENPTRQRFTMAHELAHLLCGDDQGLHVDENVMAGSRGDASEVRANAFAAALLMPESALAKRFDQPVVTETVFAEAVMDLKVSPSSLAWRLLNLKLLSPERRSQLGAMRTVDCAAVAERMNEYAMWVEASSQPRIPVRLVQDLFQAYVEGKTTLRPLANLLHVPVDVLRKAVESAPQPAGAEADDFAP
jgi:Zn-dependent peptidase ImmA (M78 family)